MFHYSRTTLRELKKRYLNVLKKCLLANLMAFMISLPVMAEETSQERTYLDKLLTDDAVVIPSGNKEIINFDFDKSIVVTNSGQTDQTKIRGGSMGEWGNTINFSGNGSLTFDNIIVTHDNPTGAELKFAGSVMNSYATVNFNTETIFLNNKLEADSAGGWTELSGGAIHLLYGPVTFKENAKFMNNKVIATNTNGATLRGYGGAISTSYKTMDFLGEARFENNSIEVNGINTAGSAGGGAIYNSYNEIITIKGIADFIGNSVFAKSDSKGGNTYGGAIYNGAGTVNFLSEANFKENKAIIELQVNGGYAQGGALYNQTYNFSGVANFIDNEAFGTLKNETGSNIGIAGGAVYNGILTFLSDANFISNKATAIVEKAWVSATGSALFAGTTNVTGKALFANNESISKSISGGGWSKGGGIQGGTHNFNAKTIFDGNKAISTSNSGYMRAMGGAISEAKISFNDEAYFYGNLVNARTGENQIGSMGGAIYNTKSIDFNGKTMFMNNTAIGSSLGTTLVEGGAIYNASVGIINLNSDFDFSGNTTITNGKEEKNDIYNAGTVNIQGSEKSVGILSGGLAGIETGVINKSGAGLLILGDLSENHEYEGTFTQTAGVTIANSEAFFSHELAQNTINGGELKTHGAEIAYKATLGETGTLTHLGTSADTPTEIKGVTFNGTGLNLTLGSYTKAEQEKEIALVGDRLVEYVDDKGTEDTSDDELVSYQATDKLFTVKVLENDQKAKFILKENLVGSEGNSITIDNAELSVADGVKVGQKVIAKDMRLTADETSSFSEVLVSENGTLDIQNQKVRADKLSFNESGTLKVGINSLLDHGKMDAKEMQNLGQGLLDLTLIGAPEEGVYEVFKSDTDLKLTTTHEFFDIDDLENGSYQIKKKSTEELADKFDLSTEETRVVSAVISGNSTHEGFKKVQDEIMETLKKGGEGKAKKALSAVGATEQPKAQSISAEHVGAVTNVVSGEMKGGAMKGHSGGDEEPRARVYIKGLYDRTKSTMGAGFKARSRGAVLGVQSEVTDDLTIGVGYAFSNTVAKEELRRTEADTNTGFLSAHYQPNAWWVSGMATYSRGQYEEEKHILSSMGKANYDVDSWGAQVMTGYDIKMDHMVITPEVGLRYLSVKQEGYTDTLGTSVSATTSDYLTAIVGLKGAWELGKLRPMAGVSLGYDIISDDVSAVNTLANGASYTVNGESLDRFSTNVTLGLEAELSNRTSLKLEYSGSFRKEYQDHSGMLRLEMRF